MNNDNNEIEELEIGLSVDNSELKDSIDEAKRIIEQGVQQMENTLKKTSLGVSLSEELNKNIKKAIDNVNKSAGNVKVKVNAEIDKAGLGNMSSLLGSAISFTGASAMKDSARSVKESTGVMQKGAKSIEDGAGTLSNGAGNLKASSDSLQKSFTMIETVTSGFKAVIEQLNLVIRNLSAGTGATLLNKYTGNMVRYNKEIETLLLKLDNPKLRGNYETDASITKDLLEASTISENIIKNFNTLKAMKVFDNFDLSEMEGQSETLAYNIRKMEREIASRNGIPIESNVTHVEFSSQQKEIEKIIRDFQRMMAPVNDTARRKVADEIDKKNRLSIGAPSVERVREEQAVLDVAKNQLDKSLESAIALLKVLDDINQRYNRTMSSITGSELGEVLNNEFGYAVSGLEKSKNNMSNIIETLAQDLGANFRNTFEELANGAEVDLDASKMENAFNTLNGVARNAANSVDEVTSRLQEFQATASAPIDTTPIQQVEAVTSATGGRIRKMLDGIKEKLSKTFIGKGISKATSGIKGLINKIKELNKGKTDKVRKEIDKVGKSAKKSGGGIKDLIGKFKGLIGTVAIFATVKKAVSDAFDAMSADRMFGTVFGDSAEEMGKWVDDLSTKYGLGATNTKKFTATIAQMGRAMGVVGQDAMKMSQTMAEMAGDISSFYNVDLENVQNDLRSALSGSFETMDKYGVILRANTVKQFAYNNGIAQMGAELTDAQRAMATTMMIQSRLGAANGSLKDSMETPAAQVRFLKSNLYELSVALGKCFMPILTVVLPILNTFTQALTRTINAIANFITQVFALFGVQVKTGIGGAVNDMATGIAGADVGSGGLADNLASGAASAKEIKKFLGGIDEINIVTTKQDKGGSGGGSGGAGGGGGVSGGDINTDAIGNGLDKVEEKFTAWQKKVANGFKAVWSSLKDGWNSVGDYIGTSLDNLKSAFAHLGTSIESFLVGAWNNGGEELIYNIGRLGGAITGLAVDIGGQVVEAIAKLYDHMNPETNANTRKFIEAMNNALEACQNFALSAGGWLRTFMDNGGQEFLNNLGDIGIMLETIKQILIGSAIQAVVDFMNSWAGQAAIKAAARKLEKLSGWLKSIVGWIRDHIGLVSTLAAVAFGLFKGLKWGAKAVKAVQVAFEAWGWISPIIEGIKVAIGAVAAAFGVSSGVVIAVIAAIVAAGYLICANWDWICEKCAQLWKALKTYWSYIYQSTINTVKNMVNGVKTWWNDLKTNVTNITNDIKTKVTNKWNEIKTSVSNTVKGIKTDIVNKWNEIKTNVDTTVTNIKNAIVNKWNETKTNVDTTVTNIKNGIRDKFTEAYNSVSTIFTNIKTSISDKINDAKDAVKKAIDKIKGFMKFEWSLPHLKMPKISIDGKFSLNPPSVPKFGITWHRQGGILPAGSNAIFGMNGNNFMAGGELSTGGEAILPLSDLFREMNGMFDRQNKQLISSLANGNSNQPINLILNLDGQKLAKAQFKTYKELAQLGIVDFSELA